MSGEKFEEADFGVGDDFGVGVESSVPVPDDEGSFKIPRSALPEPLKVERGEEHRAAQRLGALNQWPAKDRREGVAAPVKNSKPPSAAKRDALEVVLLMQRAESPHIKKALDEFVRCTVDDLGGWAALTAGQKALLVAEKTALLIIMACEERIVESKSLTDADGREHALLRILKDYLGSPGRTWSRSASGCARGCPATTASP